MWLSCKKIVYVAAHWSIKNNLTSAPKAQIVIFEVFNNAVWVLWDEYKRSKSHIPKIQQSLSMWLVIQKYKLKGLLSLL